MKIYTRSGDSGETGLIGGERVRKNSPVIVAVGSLDELNAFLGQLDVSKEYPSRTTVNEIQSKIFEIGAAVASSFADPRFLPVELPILVQTLEREIDEMTMKLPPLTNFILPTGSTNASSAHVCRAVCRRCERDLVSVSAEHVVPEDILTFVNRLSDWLFTVARTANHIAGVKETIWIKS